MRPAICIMAVKPHSVWLEMLSKIRHYDVYVVVDTLNTDYGAEKAAYPSVQIIQVMDRECRDQGFVNSSHMENASLVFNEIIAWDRALCYFSKREYELVWFFEEDAFFYDEETIAAIDRQYPVSDLLCADKERESLPDEWQWFWPAIHIEFSRPYFHAPICATRMSKRLLKEITDYAEMHRTLFFIEAMFPTLCVHHQLLYDIPKELKDTIRWRHDWNTTNTDRVRIFHPIKDMGLQDAIRKNLISMT